jgi:low affinity Fe/Cu permease
MDIISILTLIVGFAFFVIVLVLFLRERKHRKEQEMQNKIEEARRSRFKREEERRRIIGCGDMGFIEDESTNVDDQDYEDYCC